MYVTKYKHIISNTFHRLALKISPTHKQAEQIKPINSETYFNETSRNSAINEIQLNQLFPNIDKISIEVGAIDPDTAHKNHVDMLYVCAIARYVKAQYIFEFGTYLGRTTHHLALGEEAKHVYSLDLDPKKEYPDNLKLGQAIRNVHKLNLQGVFFQDQNTHSKITQLHGDSRFFDYSLYSGKIDYIFIDGAHSYDVASSDTQHAFQMLKKGGVIVWHDFSSKSPDIVKLAKEIVVSRPLFWIANTSLLIYIDGLDANKYIPEIPPYARKKIKPPSST